MNILFIITELDSASGICVNRVADCLTKRGHGVKILTETQLSESRERVFCTNRNQNLYEKYFFLKRLLVILNYYRWPIYDSRIFKRLRELSRQVLKTNDVDVVIPVYNSIDALKTGYWIKSHYPSIKYVPYFLDGFYGGQKPRFMPEWIRKRKALGWENKLLKIADGVVMMEATREAYQKLEDKPDFLKKVVFLDIPLFDVNLRNYEEEKTKQGVKRILFIGSMPRNIRPPKRFLKLFSEINPIEEWELVMVGKTDYQKEINSFAEKDSRIKYFEEVTYEKAQRLMREADVLLNIGNNLKHMIPSKIFEYMSLGKPIITTYRIEEDPSLRYFENYDELCIINENEDEKTSCQKIESFLNNYVTNIENRGQVRKKNCDVSSFYKNNPEAFCEYIERFI